MSVNSLVIALTLSPTSSPSGVGERVEVMPRLCLGREGQLAPQMATGMCCYLFCLVCFVLSCFVMFCFCYQAESSAARLHVVLYAVVD